MPTVLSSSSSFRRYDDNIDLNILQDRARHWIEYILEEPLPQDKPLPDLLADGVILDRVGQAVRRLYQSKFGNGEDQPSQKKSMSRQQTWGSKVHWEAMAHVSSFLKACSEVGLTDVHLCTPQDVVQQKNLRNVYLCVRTLAIRLYHVKVVEQEFEPVESGSTPVIYQEVHVDSGQGKVESVVRRIDEGIFSYPPLKVRLWEEEEEGEGDGEEYDYQSAEERERGRRLSYYSEGSLNSDGELATPARPRLNLENGAEPRETGSGGEATEAAEEVSGTSQGPQADGVEATPGNDPGVEGPAPKKGPRSRRRRSMEGIVQGEMQTGGEGGSAPDEGLARRPGGKGRGASSKGSRGAAGSREQGQGDGTGRSRHRRGRTEDAALPGREVRAVVRRGRGRGGRKGGGEGPFWKEPLERLQELPLGLVIGGAAAAAGLVGGILFLLFRPKRQYTVQKGDCLIQIAQKVGKKKWEEIYKQNPDIEDPNLIHTQTVLKL